MAALPCSAWPKAGPPASRMRLPAAVAILSECLLIACICSLHSSIGGPAAIGGAGCDGGELVHRLQPGPQFLGYAVPRADPAGAVVANGHAAVRVLPDQHLQRQVDRSRG